MSEVEASPFLICEFLNGKASPSKILQRTKGEDEGGSLLYVGYLLSGVKKDTESMIYKKNVIS